MVRSLTRRSYSSVPHVSADLTELGAALIRGVCGPRELLCLAAELGAVVPHRDSRPDGVTVLEDRGNTTVGMAGFSSRPLAPHTDRSSVPTPPGLVLAVCGSAPASGGEVLLVDGRAVYEDLAASNPEALEALCTPRTALFGGADWHLGSVFTPHGDPGDTVAVRLRLDGLARFSPTVTPHLPALRAAIERHQHVIPLTVGTGYVVNNHPVAARPAPLHRQPTPMADHHEPPCRGDGRVHGPAVHPDRIVNAQRPSQPYGWVSMTDVLHHFLTRWRTNRHQRRHKPTTR